MSYPDYFEALDSYRIQFQQIAQSKIRQLQQQLVWLVKQLKHPDRRLQEHAQGLDRIEGRMQLAINNRIAIRQSELSQLQRGLLASSPAQKIQHSQA